VADVVDAKEGRAEHLVSHKEVPKVAPREAARAGETVAEWVEGPLVEGVAGVPNPKRPICGECVPLATVPGRKDAIEHIDPREYRREDVAFVTDPHQVPRAILGKHGGDGVDRAMDLVGAFANRNSPDRKAR
jgi:hypothetical protein